MSAGLSGAMKAGTPPINSIASPRAPIQSVCGSDPRDVTVKYAQAYLRPVLAPWPNQAPMLMRALHTGRIAPTLILSARLIGRCDHPQAHFKQNTSFNLRMAIR